MTDLTPELDTVPDDTVETSGEKDNGVHVNNAAVTSTRHKLNERAKKRKMSSDTTKNHRRSRSSRKSKNVQKIVDIRNQKEIQDSGERRSSSENHSGHSLHTHVKEEIASDDQQSSVSDNRRHHITRARFRRIERRKAYSSNSSALESDNRKTKSEPIIITIDSDTDDNVSVVSNRPNRGARIRGEILRKLSGTTTKVTNYKAFDSSSSSEFESVKQKKKSKSKSIKTSSSQAAKRKKYLVNRLACKSRLKLRKHRKSHIAHSYRSLRKKRGVRSIRSQLNQKKGGLSSKASSVPSRKSQQTSVFIERRTLRSTSTDTVTDNATKPEALIDNVKVEKNAEGVKAQGEVVKSHDIKKTSAQGEVVKSHDIKKTSAQGEVVKSHDIKKTSAQGEVVKSHDIKKTSAQGEVVKSHDIKKTSDVVHTKKHTRKEGKNMSLENKDIEDKCLKVELPQETNEEPMSNTNSDPPSTIKVEQTCEPVTELLHPIKIGTAPNVIEQPEVNKDLELPCSTNIESTNNSRLEEPETNNNTEPTSDLKEEQKTNTTKPENQSSLATASKPEDKGNTVKQKSSNTRPLAKLKKKIKPADKILRKRGRPRLSEMRPVKEIPIINDMVQIPFLQSSFCFAVASKLPKCRECRILVNRSNRFMPHAYCRFMEYRKLCYSKNGSILNAGFSEPSDATTEHLNQWLPQLNDPPKDLNCNTSKALLEHIGDQFCDLVDQEKEALTLHIGREKVITWKRIVQGVREMCDVCYTTLFNIHWVCPICGLAVCIDCYKGRNQGITIEYEEGQPKNRDQYNWLLCTMRQPHDPEKLVMAQIIAGNALWNMRDLLHKARKIWNIPSYCKCNPQSVTSSDKYVSTGICKQLMCFVTKSFSTERSSLYFSNDSNVQNGDSNYDDLDIEVSGTALKWLEGSVVNNSNSDGLKASDDYFNSYEDFASLRGNLLNGFNGEDSTLESEREITSFSLDEIIACVTNPQSSDNKENSGKTLVKHFSNRYPHPNSGRDPLPIRIYTKLESNLAFSNVPHSWFCNGRLLFLLQSDHVDNLALFQEQWKRGQPILVKGVDERLSKELWHPDAFCRDFGEVRNDLVDCRTGAVIRNLPMKRFWEGFESFNKRMKDDGGEFMLLKLKDWPPGEDFSEMLPRRFLDLMKGLPLPEYTHRDGILNLAGRLPSWFVRPDLGPKMYNAYGSALYPTKGTTNLHLDVSDAVNVMVYVGIPQDGNAQLHIEEALKAIDEGGCDSLMRARVRARGAKPGALWHIYNARDADKIRELLTKVAMERGEKLEAHHDPIHDQSWYLDAELRKRLYRDYGVEGYAIAQCLGDAVFIPAGAPHQVRNLHSCVKVAEDFVSPENIAHCFKLTQEFRHLSDTHTNHEDKLQIKNIIYHVVRDALAHLLSGADSVES